MTAQEIALGGHAFLLREVTPRDAADVLYLFTRVFGEQPPEGWYAWKYGTEGLQGRALGLWTQQGELVAHYGGFPSPLLWLGHPVDAMQIGDVMVAPEIRGLFTRRGPFYQICNAFFNRWIGVGKPFRLAYGFPNDRAKRLGERLDLYVPLCEMMLLSWSAAEARLPLGWQMRELDLKGGGQVARNDSAAPPPHHGHRERIERIRDQDYLLRRFVRRPGIAYRFLKVSRFGLSQALAIVLPTGRGLRWVDFVGAHRALPAAAAAVRHLARSLGLDRVETWASPPVAKMLQALGARREGVAAYCVVAKCSDCTPEELARHGWWWAGDTDFL